MSREDMTFDQPDPVYLYIDELQNFVTTSLPAMLSEAAKFGLSLVTANQYLKQLTGPTLDAILGTVGTNIVFATGTEDARNLGLFFAPFSGVELERQDKYKAVVKMQPSGQSVEPFSMMALSPQKTPKDAQVRINRIRQHSRALYGRPAKEVDQELLGQAEPEQEISPNELYKFFQLGKLLNTGDELEKEDLTTFQNLGNKVRYSLQERKDDEYPLVLPPGTNTEDFDPYDFSDYWE